MIAEKKSTKRFSEAPNVISPNEALAILTGETPLYAALALAAAERERWFGKSVRIHVLDNIKNGNCAEDCGYCVQRRGAATPDAATPEGSAPIQEFPLKSEEEILADARAAKDSGAYRFCMVSAGTGPSRHTTEKLAKIIGRINSELGMRVCLSAGFVDDAKAQLLSAAGLDRYNHNLNTSAEHYTAICSTHTYADRKETIASLSGAGVGICSGVIAGLGETPADLVAAALELKALRVISIPVNFFIPVPGHAIRETQPLTPEFCLRVLIVFRLINPDSEIRIAAGREGHLRSLQATALMVANSLFASGYLNVKGSDMEQTLQLIADAGYRAEVEGNSQTQGAFSGTQAPYAPENFSRLLKFPRQGHQPKG